ncbi:MscS family membrane protein [Chitinophaga skermanii]|uniref:MscS family membrane protein n=1 Tax=Chitinophaga skermanii TaxID=331697 RepID=A0A327QJT2_9BACT|nr:mechanosensitive ion channel domain-containing protein [Chitinophaga skermanii]RAJ03934.1 MscS family membrane protein [Chitinophaga skermanii]
MPEFFSYKFLDNTVQDYTAFLISLLVIFLIKRYLSKGIARLFFNLVKRWAPKIERNEFVEIFVKPLEWFLVLFTFFIAINKIKFPSFLNLVIYKKTSSVVVNGEVREQLYQVTLHSITDTLMQITLCVSVIWILLRLIDFISLVLHTKAAQTADKTDDQFVIFFKDFFKAIVFIIGMLAVTRILFGAGLVAKLIAGLGIGAAAMALAAKESIENLIGSFIIFFDKPFHVGDTVKVDAYQGTVEKIGLRSTRIRTLDKTFVTVPNKKMVDSVLDNLSLRTQQRVVLKLELDSHTNASDMQKVLSGITHILEEHPSIEKGFTVNLNDIIKDTYVIQVIYLTNIIEGKPYNSLREFVNLSIMRLLAEQKVSLASKSESA